MKTYKSILISSLLATALFVSACGQKEEETHTRIRGGGIAGVAADGATKQAQDQLDTQGVGMSISSIAKQSDNSSGFLYVKTALSIGSTTGEIRTGHPLNRTGKDHFSGTVAGMPVDVTGYCADTKCDWYYLNIDVFQGQNFLYQVGVLRDFLHGQDLYKVNLPAARMNPSDMFQALYNSY